MTYKEWKKRNPDIIAKRKEERRMEKEAKYNAEHPHYEPPVWPVVIAGFPGVGKSYAAEHSEEWGFKIVNLEDTDFLWGKNEEGKLVKNGNYPDNYTEEIEKLLHAGQSVDVILVSTNSKIQEALLKKKIRFVAVYPKEECKEEYVRRFIRSGKPFSFVDTVGENWDSYMQECKNRAKNGQDILRLGTDKYLDEDFILDIRRQYGTIRAAAMVAREQL